MAIPRISVTLGRVDRATSRLQFYYDQRASLDTMYQRFVAELIHLRLFGLFEDSVEDLACKLLAGATYSNGSSPKLQIQARSVVHAKTLMLTYARRRPRQALRWGKARDIRDSVVMVMDSSEHFLTFAHAHAPMIDEMRKVRNYVAHHDGSSAARQFRHVVRTNYGANINVAAGAFLLTQRRWPTPKLQQYLTAVPAILADMVSG